MFGYVKKKEYDEAIKLGENDKSEVIQSIFLIFTGL